MRKKTKKLAALLLSLLMVISMIPTTKLAVEAAAMPKLAKKSVSIVIGETSKIQVKNAPKEAEITYKSAKKNIATVSKKGMVKGLKSGTTKITVSIKNNSKTTKLDYNITVKKPELSKTNLSLVSEKTAKLSVKNRPKKAQYTWKSSEPRIATVNKTGKVTAKAQGTATISVKIKTEKKTYNLSCKVTVKPKSNNSNITTCTVTFNSNGGSAVASQTVKKNDSAKQPADPTRSDYTFDGWFTAASGGTKFNFNTPITANLTLYAHWSSVGNSSSGSSSSSSGNNETYVVTFDSNGGSAVASQTIEKNGFAKQPADPTRNGYTFDGWFTATSGGQKFHFNTAIITDITLYAKWVAFGEEDNVDDNHNGIPNWVESYYNLSDKTDDTDGDGLSDYVEIYESGTDPTMKDTNGDGISDADEDSDHDNLSNIQEVKLGTDLKCSDSDSDGLTDGAEVGIYHTNPLSSDTDGDGVSDGKEVELQTDPLTAEETFAISYQIADYDANDTVMPKVDITLNGEQVETLSIEPVNNETLFPEDMPGYMGKAYDFHVDGNFETATISFDYGAASLTEDAEPTIYYFAEQNQELIELDTIIEGSTASAIVEHFSTYILIDRKKYNDSNYWEDTWSTDASYSDAEVVFIIDDSGSMTVNDSKNERLNVAKTLIDHLPKDSKIGIVQFESYYQILTSELTTDRDLAKSYLTTSSFNSQGGTSMYRAIGGSFGLFSKNPDNDGNNDHILRTMIVLSDGETSDTYQHNSIVENARNLGVKIYTIGLGRSTSYFTRYLQPLAKETSGAFYLAQNASELAAIYEDIGKKIDIETDSDNDGIPDYYEDHMIAFNGTDISTDKNNPDTDGDGLKDGEEVKIQLIYNDDKTKVIVKGKIDSNPLLEDSDYDGTNDNEDEAPLDNWFGGKLTTDYATSNISTYMDYRWFFDDNKTYNEKLSVLSILLSSAIYSGNSLSLHDSLSAKTVDSKKLENILTYLGMDSTKTISLDTLYHDKHLSEVGLGYRTVTYDGKDKTIVAVVVRGTNASIEEWSSNFDIGDKNNSSQYNGWKNKNNHAGFDIAANRIMGVVSDYIKLNHLNESEIAYWVTGHSRGAAIANIIGANLEDAGAESFTYTFAAPNTTLSLNAKSYRTIFNVINTDDFVPCLPMEGWGYRRYGRIASVSVAGSFEKEWEEMTGKHDYNPDSGDMDGTVNAITNILNKDDDARIACYSYTCSCHGDGSNDRITIINRGISESSRENAIAKIPGNALPYCQITRYDGGKIGGWDFEVCQTPSYFMQLLAAIMGKQINGYRFGVELNIADRYENAKKQIVDSYLSGIEHPHYTESYYVLANRIHGGRFH